MSEVVSEQVYHDRLYENDGLLSLVDLLGMGHLHVLDVGCGNGANLQLLFERGHEAIGITFSEAEARAVRERGFTCIVHDITRPELPFPGESFDALIFSHVLEHVPWPQEVLRRYTALLRPGADVLVALPNVMHISQRVQFLRGHFRYAEMGIMDRTHLRFFDFPSARRLVEEAGLRVTRSFGVGQVPVGPLRERLPRLAAWLDRVGPRLLPGLFAVHLIIAGKLAGVRAPEMD